MDSLPLHGIHIVDWTHFMAGPTTSVRLAALGAQVIHIEQPGIGDSTRGGQKLKGVNQVLKDGKNAGFEASNFNKKSIALDLSKPKGREILYQLVEKADIFVTNMLTDVVNKMCMDYETLLNYNPRLIYANASLQGPKGPYNMMPGWDPVGQACSGMMAANGCPEEPRMGAAVTSDHITDLSLSFGIMTALFLREKTGQPQHVETSQLQAGMNGLLYSVIGTYLLTNGEVYNNAREDQLNALNIWYRCKDGRWIQLAALTEKYWRKLCEEIERPELIEDPRFIDLKKRSENRKELIKILDNVFSEKTIDEWTKKFTDANVPCYAVNRICDLPSDPQVVANNYLLDFNHPTLGPIKLPGLPFAINDYLGKIVSPAPELGEHTEEILLELGYSWEQIGELRDGMVTCRDFKE